MSIEVRVKILEKEVSQLKKEIAKLKKQQGVDAQQVTKKMSQELSNLR